jgi:hypothetical protein
LRSQQSKTGDARSFVSRRDFLCQCGAGLGWLGLAGVLADAQLLGAESRTSANPLAARAPHFPGRARRVIHFFLNGGPSHVDMFDPKPALARYNGQPLPLENLRTERKTGAAFASPFQFSKHGKSGLEISDLFPRLATHADELCVIRSMQAHLPNHEPSLMLMNCGDQVMRSIEKLIEHIRNNHSDLKLQRKQLDFVAQLNLAHQRARDADPNLEARIQSFELAFRMQMEAAEAFDIGKEPEAVREAYGQGVHGRQTLIARRLLERGVRYIQLWHGEGQPWDHHDGLREGHKKLAMEIDQPIAALLTDLKNRSMLDETLVIIGGEFGRTPVAELVKSKPGGGRDHNPYGFSVVLAGGGIRGGLAYGATDEFGFKAVENPVQVHDLHATILHLLGFDHEKLTYRYAGRDFRLTDVHGHVVKAVLA